MVNEMYFEVPPTIEMGSYRANCSNKKDALYSYNSARSHDGLPPLLKMPRGTKYYKSIRQGTNTDGSSNYIFKRVD